MGTSIFFRALEPEDADLIYLWKNDAEMMKDAVGMSRFWSKRQCQEWVESKSKQDPFNYWFAICLNDETKRMIGYCGVNHIHFVNSSATCDAVVIGDKQCRDGISWIETYLLLYEYVFEKLHLNRFYGSFMATQQSTEFISELMFMQKEGVEKECYFKDGRYIDGFISAILASEYLEHKRDGDFELSNILKRVKFLVHKRKEK